MEGERGVEGDRWKRVQFHYLVGWIRGAKEEMEREVPLLGLLIWIIPLMK